MKVAQITSQDSFKVSVFKLENLFQHFKSFQMISWNYVSDRTVPLLDESPGETHTSLFDQIGAT